MKLSDLIKKLQEIQSNNYLEGIDPEVYVAFWSDPANYNGIDKISDYGISFDNRETLIITSVNSQRYGYDFPEK